MVLNKIWFKWIVGDNNNKKSKEFCILRIQVWLDKVIKEGKEIHYSLVETE